MNTKIFTFLKKLKANNNREWFLENKELFETAKAEANQLFEEVYKEFQRIDSNLEPLKIYRIYRDVRFSPDKTPYKAHFSMSVGRVKPDLRGGYYLHIEPNNQSFIGVGFFGPNKEDLLRIRKEIELDDELEIILNTKEIKEVFGELEGEEVKTAPKGFDKNHERIHLIKKKQFLLTYSLTDEEILQKDFHKKAVAVFKTAQPFVDYMTDVLLSDLNGERMI